MLYDLATAGSVIIENLSPEDKPGLTYMATAYNRWPSGRPEAFAFACTVARDFAKLYPSHTVFSPIAHGHALNSIGVSMPEWFWRAQDMQFLKVTKFLFVVADPAGNWRDSRGIMKEVETFLSMGPVFLYDPSTPHRATYVAGVINKQKEDHFG